MKLCNKTHYKISKAWLGPILRSLNVEPTIKIEYAESPYTKTIPNYKHKFGAKFHEVDGLAIGDRVYIYCGKWTRGKYRSYTTEFVQWILLHELRHVYFYNLPPNADPWKGCTAKQRERREEVACSRYANKMMGVRKRADLPRFDINAKGQIQTAGKNRT